MTEQSQGQATSESTTTTEQSQSQEERTFTQADLKKIAANEKREGRNSVLAELGVDDLDGLKQIVTDYRAAEEEAQSDLDRLEKEREALKEQVKAANKLADDRLIGAELRSALMGAGVPSDRLKDALALTDRSALTVEKDGTVSGLEDAVQATLEPRPWLAEVSEPQAPRRAADVSQRTTQNGSQDPQQQHANFLASLLNGP